MKLPVWVTVFVSGIVGGWIGGVVSQALFLPLMFHTSPKSLAAHWMLVILIGGVCQAAITGGARVPSPAWVAALTSHVTGQSSAT